MKEQIGQYLHELLADIAATDSNIALFAVLLVAIVIVLDAVSMFASERRKKVGIEARKNDATNKLAPETPAVRHYVSEMQGLAGRPDALISENGYIIPIERKPLARKIRDRYVAQLLVYMRLVEEFEGKKPPYGYLVLGPQCRRVKIQNTEARQAWLQKIIDEMRAVLHKQQEVRPAPHPRKCRKCNMRNACDHRMELPQPAPQQSAALKVLG